jgi:hypothetical protein
MIVHLFMLSVPNFALDCTESHVRMFTRHTLSPNSGSIFQSNHSNTVPTAKQTPIRLDSHAGHLYLPPAKPICLVPPFFDPLLYIITKRNS